MIYSDWMVLEDLTKVDTALTLIGSGNLNVTKYDFPAPDLTQEMIDGGSILVFARRGGGPIIPLPFNFLILSNTYAMTHSVPEPGLIWVFVYRLDNTPVSLTFVARIEIRYVLIPGGVPAAVGENVVDYEVVRQYFGIPD